MQADTNEPYDLIDVSSLSSSRRCDSVDDADNPVTAYAEAAIDDGSVDFLGISTAVAPMIESNDILRQLTTPPVAPVIARVTLSGIESNTFATDGDNRLTKLLENVTEGQWSPVDDLDWDQVPTLPKWISPKLYTAAVSQRYYGEIATIWACQRLLEVLTGTRVRQFLRAQSRTRSAMRIPTLATFGDWVMWPQWTSHLPLLLRGLLHGLAPITD